MAHKLPDELLSNILAPLLRIPPHLFSDTQFPSVFSHTRSPFLSPSPANLLIVNKRWMRICTPLLYEFVILRSNAQATAFGLVLTAHPEFGAYVKRLRIEGGYGATMEHALPKMGNLTHLWMTLQLWSKDNAAGLVKALPKVNPVFVVVHDDMKKPVENSNAKAALDGVCECIRSKWTRLERCHVPLYANQKHTTRVQQWVDALVASTSVKHIKVDRPVMSYIDPLPFMVQLAANPRVESIELTGMIVEVYNHYEFPEAVKKDARLERLLSVTRSDGSDVRLPYRHSPSPVDPAAPNPFYVPLTGQSDAVKRKIWSRILELVLCVEPWVLEERDNINGLFYRLGLVEYRYPAQVCRLFRELGRPFLFQTIALKSTKQALSLVQRLSRPSGALLGTYIHNIIMTYTSGQLDLSPLLPFLPNLRRIECQALVISPTQFATLASTVGGTLEVLRTVDVVIPSEAGAWKGLRRLRVLGAWDNGASKKAGKGKKGGVEEEVPRDGLPMLEELMIWLGTHPLLLGTLAKMDLPSLHTLESNTSRGSPLFISTHGPKFKKLTVHEFAGDKLDCPGSYPALEELVVNVRIQPRTPEFPKCMIDLVKLSTPHTAMRKIVIHAMKENFEKKPADREQWHRFFKDSVPLFQKNFPARPDIVLGQISWPSTEKDILRSELCRWAEALYQSGFKVSDNTGYVWKPRLGLGR